MYNGEISLTSENLDSNYILSKVQHLNTRGNKIKIGILAGFEAQGDNAIAIGNYSGQNYQANNSITINSTGTQLQNTIPNSLKIAPIREDVGNYPFLNYNTTTKEITYQSVAYLSRPFAQFINTNSIPLTQNTIIPITYNQTPTANGISYDLVNPSHIKFTATGNYKIGTSILLEEVGGSGAEAYIAFRKNGTAIENSGSECFINGNNKRTLAYVEIIIEITNIVTDYIEVIAFTADPDILSPSVPSPTPLFPSSPSVITTCYKVN